MRLTAPDSMRVVEALEGRRLTRGMLQHYTREGYVKPRGVPERASRRGRPATVSYDLTDVILLRWLVRLNAQGVKLSRFSRGLRSLRKLLPEAIRTPEELTFFVVDKGDYAVKIPGGVALQLTGHVGQVLLALSSQPDFPETLSQVRTLGASESPASTPGEQRRRAR